MQANLAEAVSPPGRSSMQETPPMLETPWDAWKCFFSKVCKTEIEDKQPWGLTVMQSGKNPTPQSMELSPVLLLLLQKEVCPVLSLDRIEGGEARQKRPGEEERGDRDPAHHPNNTMGGEGSFGGECLFHTDVNLGRDRERGNLEFTTINAFRTGSLLSSEDRSSSQRR